jgi:adenosylmethionine---8-amino-7-oxononanoate aminotransferase
MMNGGGEPETANDRGARDELRRETLWRPYCQMKTAGAALPVVGAEGIWLELESGQRLIDGISSWWTVCHGHRHPHIVEAITKQATVMPHVMLGGIEHPQARRLADRLSKLLPGDLNHCFFCDSGSVAVEVAMKIAVQYWLNQGVRGRNRFVTLRHSYHGDTTGAMSISDPDDSMHRHFRGYLLEQFPAALPDTAEGWRDFDRFLAVNAGQCAGLIAEPLVQGAAGVRMHRPEQLARLAEAARKWDLLFIADEIATGFGRTGTLLACEQAAVVPDLICLGKALTGGHLPLAVTVATTAVFGTFWSDDPDAALMHGPTYMGNPICCAAANASLDLFEREPRLEQVKRLQSWAAGLLEPLRRLPQVVDVRHVGGFMAVEMASPFDRRKLLPLWLDARVWLRPIGNVIYAAPPFVIQRSEFEQVVDAMRRAVERNR